MCLRWLYRIGAAFEGCNRAKRQRMRAPFDGEKKLLFTNCCRSQFLFPHCALVFENELISEVNISEVVKQLSKVL